MNILKAIVCVASLTFGSLSVRADWNLGQPFKMHYPQLPDLTPNGLDVLDGPRFFLSARRRSGQPTKSFSPTTGFARRPVP